MATLRPRQFGLHTFISMSVGFFERYMPDPFVSEGLTIAPEKHAPIFERTDDGMVLPQPWCMGFLTAMRLRQQDWRPLLDLSRLDHGLMLPILLYCTGPLGRPMLGPPREGPETEEFLRTAYHDIAVVIPAIRDYGMPQRLLATRNQS